MESRWGVVPLRNLDRARLVSDVDYIEPVSTAICIIIVRDWIQLTVRQLVVNQHPVVVLGHFDVDHPSDLGVVGREEPDVVGFADIEDFEDTDENYIVHIESEDSGILIGRQGKTLDALQFLLNLLVTPELQKRKRILVDVARYRERRKKKLTKLARSVGDRVAKSGRSVLLESMNPYERRIVHLTLEEDDRVTTRSEGNGLYKRVRVVILRTDGDDVEEEYYEEEAVTAPEGLPEETPPPAQ